MNKANVVAYKLKVELDKEVSDAINLRDAASSSGNLRDAASSSVNQSVN